MPEGGPKVVQIKNDKKLKNNSGQILSLHHYLNK
jgi:hypothetical protein